MKQARSRTSLLGANALFCVVCLGLALVIGLLTAVILAGFSNSQPKPKTSMAMPIESGASIAALDRDTKQATAAPVAAEQDEETSKDVWLNALSGLEFTPFDQAAPQILRALQSKDREVRLRAVNLLVASKDNAAILPLLAIAQRDVDAEVRRDALAALNNSSLTVNLTPYLLSGAIDGDEEVRSSLVETAWSLSPGQRDEFIAQAVHSSWQDVSSSAFEMLKHESSRKTVELLLNVYATNNITQIKNANDVMDALVNQTFSNATEAAAWWQQNQGNYQDDLSLKIANSDSNP